MVTTSVQASTHGACRVKNIVRKCLVLRHSISCSVRDWDAHCGSEQVSQQCYQEGCCLEASGRAYGALATGAAHVGQPAAVPQSWSKLRVLKNLSERHRQRAEQAEIVKPCVVPCAYLVLEVVGPGAGCVCHLKKCHPERTVPIAAGAELEARLTQLRFLAHKRGLHKQSRET